MAARVNILQLRREIEAQEARTIQPRMKEIMNKTFEEEKRALLKEFDNNSANKELKAGAQATSPSTRAGNLYSFLGFVDGVQPVDELRNALEDGITKGRVTKANGRGQILKYNMEVRIPTMEELKRKTRLLVWIDRSFIDYIENGLDNLKRYIFDANGFRTSRSGTGIQINGDIKGKRPLRGRNYVTKMLSDFKNRLKKFNGR